MQPGTGTEKRARPDDDSRQSGVTDQALDQTVALGLGDGVWLLKRPERESLVGGSSQVHAVDRPRADMDEATHAHRQSRPGDVLCARHVDRTVVGEWPPDAHHAGEVQHGFHPTHGSNQRLGPADVTGNHRDATLIEPRGVFIRKREHAHRIAAPLKFRYEMAAEQAVAPGDQHVHVSSSTTPATSGAGDMPYPPSREVPPRAKRSRSAFAAQQPHYAGA